MKTIDFKLEHDGVAILTIDVKDKPMNVITPEFLDDLAESIERIRDDKQVKGAVITSGKDSFMAGADLKGLVDSFAQRTNAAEVYEFCSGYQRACARWKPAASRLLRPSTAPRSGGGLELCLACHYRVAAINPNRCSGCPKSRLACCRAPAARSGCRA